MRTKIKEYLTDLFCLAKTVAPVSVCTSCGLTFQIGEANKTASILAGEGGAPHVCFPMLTTMKDSQTRKVLLWFYHRLVVLSLQLRHGSHEAWEERFLTGSGHSLITLTVPKPCTVPETKAFGSQQECDCSSNRV